MTLLFMCVANSARSQMAERLARRMFPDAEIQSAGSNPTTVSPYAMASLQEMGIDISRQFSKSVEHLSPKFTAELNYIVTLCAEEVCPAMVSQKAKRLHWPIPDPASKESLPESEMLARFRRARNAIQEKLKELKAEIER